MYLDIGDCFSQDTHERLATNRFRVPLPNMTTSKSWLFMGFNPQMNISSFIRVKDESVSDALSSRLMSPVFMTILLLVRNESPRRMLGSRNKMHCLPRPRSRAG